MPQRQAIDMRVRPPAPGFETLGLYWDKPRIIGMTRDVGFEPPPSYVAGSLPDCLAEMTVAGITLGVVTGRMAGRRMGRVSNSAIAELVSHHPDRFIGYGGVDIADAGVPVLLMAGGNAGPDLTFSHPVQIDRLAARHSRLQIIAAHGSWPWITEILGVAFRRGNVWVSPDMYLFLPGGRMYVEAANGCLQDRFLFGTAYPALPFKAAVDRFLALPFHDTVRPKILYENAQRLLGDGA